MLQTWQFGNTPALMPAWLFDHSRSEVVCAQMCRDADVPYVQVHTLSLGPMHGLYKIHSVSLHLVPLYSTLSAALLHAVLPGCEGCPRGDVNSCHPDTGLLAGCSAHSILTYQA